MELFLLALLATVAALDDDKPVPRARLPVRDEPEPDHRRAIEFWTGFMGEPVAPWNGLQEAAWLCDKLVCPEGHIGDENDQITLDMDAKFLSYPMDSNSRIHKSNWYDQEFEKSRKKRDGTYEVWEAIPPTGHCNHPGHRGPRRFLIPSYVLSEIMRDW